MRNVPMNRSEHPIFDFRRELDRFVEDFLFMPSFRSRDRNLPWMPIADLEESDDHYLINLEMPGIAREDIKIEFLNGQLNVSGEIKGDDRTLSDGRRERHSGRFFRSFALPTGIDADRVEARCRDGLLKIYVPKAESAKPRTIKIEEGGTGGIFDRLLGRETEEKITKEPTHEADKAA